MMGVSPRSRGVSWLFLQAAHFDRNERYAYFGTGHQNEQKLKIAFLVTVLLQIV